ncbi:MAG TPA: hypothetical protein VJ756_00510, partial [Terriglobales bacterium]|nr:hypothetical protein [Terriglobales bacterium]
MSLITNRLSMKCAKGIYQQSWCRHAGHLLHCFDPSGGAKRRGNMRKAFIALALAVLLHIPAAGQDKTAV